MDRDGQDGQTERQNQNQRSIHLEMQKERSSKETNKVGGSFRENRERDWRVRRNKIEKEREREIAGKEQRRLHFRITGQHLTIYALMQCLAAAGVCKACGECAQACVCVRACVCVCMHMCVFACMCMRVCVLERESKGKLQYSIAAKWHYQGALTKRCITAAVHRYMVL